jgi:hypothetical protein
MSITAVLSRYYPPIHSKKRAENDMVCQDKLQISSVGPRHLDFPMHFDSQGDGYKNTTFLNNISYFTDVDSELDGGTAMLTGSHLTDTVWIMRTHSVASMIATCHHHNVVAIDNHAGFYPDTPRTAIGQERALNGQGDPAADKALHLNGMSAFKSVTVSVSNADFPRQAQDRREKLTRIVVRFAGPSSSIERITKIKAGSVVHFTEAVRATRRQQQ